MNSFSVFGMFGIFIIKQTLLFLFINNNFVDGLYINLCDNGWNSRVGTWIYDYDWLECALSVTSTGIIWYGENDGQTYDNNLFNNCKKYSIETLCSINGPNDCGILFESTDVSGSTTSGSNYLFVISPYDNVVKISQSNGGTGWNEILYKVMSFSYNTYYELRIERVNTLYTFYIDNNIIWKNYELTNGNNDITGSFGLRTYGGSGIDVRYFSYECDEIIPTMNPTLKPTAPTLSPTQKCLYTHECHAWGNQHITTFDNTFYHFQGEGYFDYITDDCDDSYSSSSSSLYLPFTISARHDYCNNANSVTCVKEVLVHLKDSSNTLISFPSSGNPVYKPCGNDARGSTSFADNNNNNNIVSYDISNGKFEINFFYNNDKVMLSFSYHGTRLLIRTTNCLYNSGFCGLCGKFNGDNTDDFTTCDDGTQISTNKNDYNSWTNTHLFGESCCNQEYDLEYLTNTNCGLNPPPPEKPDEQCMDENGYANQICQKFYNLYCKSCDNDNDNDDDYISNEWLEGCVYDFCSIDECIDITNIENAISSDCLTTSINECINDKYPPIFVDKIE